MVGFEIFITNNLVHVLLNGDYADSPTRTQWRRSRENSSRRLWISTFIRWIFVNNAGQTWVDDFVNTDSDLQFRIFGHISWYYHVIENTMFASYSGQSQNTFLITCSQTVKFCPFSKSEKMRKRLRVSYGLALQTWMSGRTLCWLTGWTHCPDTVGFLPVATTDLYFVSNSRYDIRSSRNQRMMQSMFKLFDTFVDLA